MKKTTGLRHLSLMTPDLKATERFYTQVLGLKVAFRVPPKRIFLSSPGGGDLLDFVRSSRKTRSGGLDHFGFKVSQDYLREIEKELKKADIEIEGRRGRSSIYFRDPNGYCVEFYCD